MLVDKLWTRHRVYGNCPYNVNEGIGMSMPEEVRVCLAFVMV